MHPVFLQSQSICVSTNSETDGMRLSSDASLVHGEGDREAGSKSVSPNSRLRHSRLISEGTYTERLAFSMRRHTGQKNILPIVWLEVRIRFSMQLRWIMCEQQENLEFRMCWKGKSARL